MFVIKITVRLSLQQPVCRCTYHSLCADGKNDDYIETPDFTLELDDVVISDIFLSLPSKNLCRDDCKGLCQICGQNLNNGECSCDKRQTDPRLEILKQLID